ncbi:hypothetical protein BDQ12DRAFT_687452, partial [Crucibulum laeve]
MVKSQPDGPKIPLVKLSNPIGGEGGRCASMRGPEYAGNFFGDGGPSACTILTICRVLPVFFLSNREM